MNELIGKSLGRYHILEQLGEGGMATVYKAYDTLLERDVAVKIIRTERLTPEAMPNALKRFEREAKSLGKLTHPNIVPISDYGEYETKPYLVMPYLSGGTLKSKLNGKPILWQDAIQILIPIARALAYAHKQDIIHRDVKPANILVTDEGEPMLSDFGIAKLLDADETMELTGTSAGIGTPEYMAPEQVTSKSVDSRVDIYALGVVLYEMVTGRKPYTADTPMAVLIMHSRDPLPRPKNFVSSLPQEVENILFKALAKNPQDRYQDMAEFAKVLEGLSKSNLPKPKDIVALEKREKRAEVKLPVTSRQTIIIIGLIALAVCLIALFSFSPKSFYTTLFSTATAAETPTPISTSTPDIILSANSISVFGQTGSVGSLISSDGQSQDLVNGIFTISKNSRIEIIQNGANINLADGSSLYMSSGTIFVFAEVGNGTELILEHGAIMVKLGAGILPLSIKMPDGFVAQVSGSIMGVQNAPESLGVFVDCYEGHCTISGAGISEMSLDDANRYLFYTAGNTNPSDQMQRCDFWKGAIGAENIQKLGYCTQQQPTATYTPNTPVNVQATARCDRWLRDHHNEIKCP